MVGTVISWLKNSIASVLMAVIGIGVFWYGLDTIQEQEYRIMVLEDTIRKNEIVIEGFKQDMSKYKELVLTLEEQKRSIDSVVQAQKIEIDKLMESKDVKESEVLRMQLPSAVVSILRSDGSTVP